MLGLLRFMVGYDRVMNDRRAALCSEVWQKRNRTSRRDFVKAYFADMVRWRELDRWFESLDSEGVVGVDLEVLSNCELVVGKDPQ
jgi:hypothetical protein